MNVGSSDVDIPMTVTVTSRLEATVAMTVTVWHLVQHEAYAADDEGEKETLGEHFMDGLVDMR